MRKFIKTSRGYLKVADVHSFWIDDEGNLFADKIHVKDFGTEEEAAKFLGELIHKLECDDYEDFVDNFNRQELQNQHLCNRRITKRYGH